MEHRDVDSIRAWLAGTCRLAYPAQPKKGIHPKVPWEEGNIAKYIAGLKDSDEARPGFVSIYEPAYYGNGKNRVFTSPNGKQGFALLDHGDGRIEIAGVYNNDPEAKGVGRQSVEDAFRMGGNYLEAFESDPNMGAGKFSLPHYYNKILGVEPTGFLPFDPQYAHPKWKHDTYGQPGIVSLTVPQGAHQDLEGWLAKKHDNYSFHDKYLKMREEEMRKKQRTASKNVVSLRRMPEDPVAAFDDWEHDTNVRLAAKKAAQSAVKVRKG